MWELKTTIRGINGAGWSFTLKWPFSLCADTKDNQCGTAEEGNGWEFACQRQVFVGGDEGHPALYTDLP